MSNIYNLEPPTKGKVVLRTTAGDIDIELWPKEAPKAVRNFVQLCLEGFYDGCAFHRVLKDFLVQTGDPTGTGTGSETIYGAPFKDEFHSRLRFSHRGIVACANENQEHSNGSQFFITLGPTESLQKKNTIFGRVAGDTIYNVMEMNNLEVDASDRPEDPPFIKEAEVLWNPFDDIEPRTTCAERLAAAERERAAAAAQARPKVKKNAALLSFEDDEGGDGDEDENDGGNDGKPAAAARIRSAHEAIDDARLVKVNTEEERQLAAQEAEETAVRKAAVQARLAKLSKQTPAGPAGGGAAAAASAEADDTDEGFEHKMRAQALAKRAALGNRESTAAAPASRNGGARPKDSDDDSDDDSDGDGGDRGRNDADKRRSAALAGGSKAALIKPSRQMSKVEDADLLKPWELKRRQYKQRARLTGARETDTLAKMRAFAAALGGGGDSGGGGGEPTAAASARDGSAGAGPSGAAEQEAYAGRVRKDIDHEALKPAAWRIDALQDEDDEVLRGGIEALRGHVLAFPKEAARGAMDRNMDDVDNLVVIDPLLEKGKEQWNRQQAKKQKLAQREAEWGGGGGGGSSRGGAEEGGRGGGRDGGRDGGGWGRGEGRAGGRGGSRDGGRAGGSWGGQADRPQY